MLLGQGVECLYRTCVDHSLERTSIGSIEGPSQSFNPTHVLQQNGRLSGTRSVIQADARTWSGHRLGVFLDKRLDYERSSGWLIALASGREYVRNLSASIHCENCARRNTAIVGFVAYQPPRGRGRDLCSRLCRWKRSEDFLNVARLEVCLPALRAPILSLCTDCKNSLPYC